MNASRTAAVVLRQYYLLRGSLSRVIPLFARVAIDIVLWGFITRWLDSVAAPGYSFVPALLGAVLLWDFFTRVMQGVTMAFFEDVWSRNFLNFFATPLRISEYLGGLVITSTATSAVGLVAMLGVATTVFGLSFLVYGAAIVPFLLVLFLFGIALGILGCALVLRLGPAAEWFVWPIPALVSPFVGVFYPLSTLPEWMRAVSWLLAPSYVFEGDAHHRGGAGGAVGSAGPGHGPGGAGHPHRRLDLHARVPARGADGAHRPLQRGERRLEGFSVWLSKCLRCWGGGRMRTFERTCFSTTRRPLASSFSYGCRHPRIDEVEWAAQPDPGGMVTLRRETDGAVLRTTSMSQAHVTVPTRQPRCEGN